VNNFLTAATEVPPERPAGRRHLLLCLAIAQIEAGQLEVVGTGAVGHLTTCGPTPEASVPSAERLQSLNVLHFQIRTERDST
jgi:hypothetical protein